MISKCKPGFAHRWIIETAEGPLSRGQCVHCTGVKIFRNSPTDKELMNINISNKPRGERGHS